MSNTFIVDTNAGISGSLTQLVDGTSYLVAGSNVTITSQSNGSVLIAASTGSAASPTISGIYGDGSDGSGVINGSVTLTADVYWTNLSVGSAGILHTNGYRVFVAGPCVVSGVIDNSGTNAVHGTSAGQLGAPAGSLAGGTRGGNASSGAAVNINGIPGVDAHGSGGNSGGTRGEYNVLSADYGSLRSLTQVIDCAVTNLSNNRVAIGGGAGGGASPGSTGGGGGGGVVMLIAASIGIDVSGSITAKGGNGAGDAAGASGAGGGGLIILVSQSSVQNAGTISVAGGLGGSGFGGLGSGDGHAGAIIQLQSL